MTRNETNTQVENSSFFDEGPEEPELCSLMGYTDCDSCYFRLNFVKRVTDKVKQQREA